MLKRIVFLATSMFVTMLLAQAPDTLWTKTYGGVDDEVCYAITYTQDGGFFLAGDFLSINISDSDIMILKVDSLGEICWQLTLTDTSRWESCRAACATLDNGVVLAGYYWSSSTWKHALVLKLDSLGDTVWANIYEEATEVNSVKLTPDGGYIVAGTKVDLTTQWNYNAFLIKLDSLGTTQWTKMIGATGTDDKLNWVHPTSDGGYIATGVTSAFSWSTLLILKVDSQGDSLWALTLSGDQAIGYAVQEMHDYNYLTMGSVRRSSPAGTDIWFVKTNQTGNVLWYKYINEDSTNEAGFSMHKTSDNGFIIAGTAREWGQGNEIYVAKIDTMGELLWSKQFNSDGITQIAYSVLQCPDETFMVAGKTEDLYAEHDFYIMKLASEQFIQENTNLFNPENQFYATILSGSLCFPEGKICKVFDITGRIVIPDKIKPGIYFIEVDGEIRQKVIKIR